MRLPFRRSSEAKPLVLSIQETISYGLVVYCNLSNAALPCDEELSACCRTWIDAHTNGSLRSAITSAVELHLVNWRVVPVDHAPPLPPVSVYRSGLSETEERRFSQSTHVVIISGTHISGKPPIGLLATLACARAIALKFGGFIFDPETLFFIGASTYDQHISSAGSIIVAEHIKIPQSVNSQGNAWFTTTGMSKFGLPNLEIADVSPDICNPLCTIVNAAAQLFVRHVYRSVGTVTQFPCIVTLPTELRITRKDVALANGIDLKPTPDGVRGWSTLYASWHQPHNRAESFLRLGPPPNERHIADVWWHGVLADLGGTEHKIHVTSTGNKHMEEAHLRAIRELPGIKARFQRGLSPGQTLYIKHGFPTKDGLSEFMWVVVKTWKGNQITGALANDPALRLDLRAGQRVDLRDSDIFDWLFVHRDETQEGGYTTAAAEQDGQSMDDQ